MSNIPSMSDRQMRRRRNTPWHDATVTVLRDAEEPLSPSEIVEAIVAKQLRLQVGATPSRTVAAIISTSMVNQRDESPFVRVARGQYALKPGLKGSDRVPEEQLHFIDDEESAGGIQAFGMYWARDDVLWRRSPCLLGQQQIGAESVNMAMQVGLYLLYDAREVIYVGRSIDRPFGVRLFEHTQDRLRARWNRFSWFGMYPVADDGTLIAQVPPIDVESLIRALEAVAIEALEPRQNRKRGDDFSGVEFVQKIDPEIERQRKLALLSEFRQAI